MDAARLDHGLYHGLDPPVVVLWRAVWRGSARCGTGWSREREDIGSQRGRAARAAGAAGAAGAAEAAAARYTERLYAEWRQAFHCFISPRSIGE